MITPDGSQHRRRVREVFAEAIGLPVDARSEYLNRACAGDPILRSEVDSLLAALARRPEFLSAPTTDQSLAGTPIASESAGAQVGPYKLLEKIGEGGFGSVFMAEQSQPVRRRVALKIVKLGMDTAAVVARFEAERQALAMMSHPNIAQVHDAGATESGRPYFVMELVRGEPITAYADRAALNVAQRLELFMQVCHAVQHAHSKGIIHRDIKPANVLVATNDGRPLAKIIDFGIAKATQQQLTERTLFTEFNQFIGTPEYMSPEQAGGAPDVDTRSDVFGLGTLLYELLAGVTPFDPKALRAKAFEEIRRIIREVEPPPPSTRLSKSIDRVDSVEGNGPLDLSAASVAGDLDWIVMKAIDKDRTRRYQTANALAEDVLRHLSGEPVLAAPPSRWYRLIKFARRHRMLVGAGAAVAGVLLLGVLGTSLGLIAAKHATRKSQASAVRAEAEAKRASEAESSARSAQSLAEYEGYIANIESAYSALRSNDATRLRTRLDACPPAQRNWEWRYLDAASDGSLLSMKHPPRTLANLVHAAYSRDGSSLVSRNGDGTVWVWDAASGKELCTLSGPEKIGGDIDMSPNHRLALAAARDATIWVWDVATGKVAAKLVGHESEIRFAAFLDDNRIVSASRDGTARVWEARTGTSLRIIRQDKAINDAILNVDGSRLATASADRTVRIWSIAEGSDPLVLLGHTESVERVRWNADGTRLVSASLDGTARTWDVRAGQPLATFRHNGRASGVDISPDGTRVVSFATQGDPSVWNAENGDLMFTLVGHTNSVLNATFSSDGGRIVTSSRDTTVRVWDGHSGVEWSCLRGHVESPWVARFSPDGERVMSSGDTTVRLWPSGKDGEQSIISRPLADCADIRLCPDQRTVIDVGRGRFRLIDLETGKETRPFEELGPFGQSAVAPDGSKVLAPLPENVVGSWDVREQRTGPSLVGHTAFVRSIAFRSDGARIVTSSEDGTARVWDAKAGTELLVVRGHEGAINSASFDRAGGRIVTAGRDKTVRMWDAESGTLLRTMDGHDSSVTTACFSPDGSRILSTSADFSARVWDANTGELQYVLRGHGHVLLDGSFSSDGSRIVTASMDGTVRLWDASNGRQILSMGGRPGGMIVARFTEDRARLLVGSTEGKAWLLDSTSVRDRLARGDR